MRKDRRSPGWRIGLLSLALCLLFSAGVQATGTAPDSPVQLRLLSAEDSHTRYFKAEVEVTFSDLAYYDYGNQYLSYHIYSGGEDPQPLLMEGGSQVLIVADAQGKTRVSITVDARSFSGEELLIVYDIWSERDQAWLSSRTDISFAPLRSTIHYRFMPELFGPLSLAFSERPIIAVINLLFLVLVIYVALYIRRRKLLTFK